MFKFSYAAKVGLIFLLAVFLLIMVLNALGIKFWKTRATKGYRIAIVFDTTKGLQTGYEVQYNGWWIGEVESISRHPFGDVEAVIRVFREDYLIHENAYFTIAKESIFGSYILYISETKGGVLKVRGKDRDHTYTLEMPAGETILNSDVYYHGAVIGTVTDIVKPAGDKFTDIITIELDEDSQVELNKRQSFVATRTREKRMPLTGEIYTAEEFITGRVDVYDPLNDGDVVPGLREPGPEDLVASANTLVLSASDAIGNVSDSLNELTMNLNTVLTGLAREITGEGEGTIKAELVEAIEELQMDLGKIRELADNLNSILLDARPRIEGILTDIEGATTSIDNATSTVDEFITDPEITESIRTAIANIEEASERVLATVEEIETLVSDEQLRADILGLVSDARDTMAKASDSIDKANAAMGTVSDTDVGGEFRVRYLTEPERVASDLEFSIAPSGSNAFYQFGVEDIGEADDFTFQLGYGGRTGMRGLFGIKRGHIGAGFDYRTDMFSLRGDVYDPNDVHFDIYGGVAISDDFRFIIGFEDLYDEDFFHIGIATEF